MKDIKITVTDSELYFDSEECFSWSKGNYRQSYGFQEVEIKIGDATVEGRIEFDLNPEEDWIDDNDFEMACDWDKPRALKLYDLPEGTDLKSVFLEMEGDD